MLRRRTIGIAALTLGVARAGAQPSPRKVGMLVGTRIEETAHDPLQLAFAESMREQGFVEGSSLLTLYRGSGPRNENLKQAVRELVALDVDLIVVTEGVTAALAAKQLTTTIPILAVGVADPVKFGLVASLARPGGNVTGIAGPVPEWGKYLELAHEAVFGATRVAVIANATSIVYADYVAQNEAAARTLGLKLQMLPVTQASDLAPAFDAMKRERAEVLVFGPDRLFFANLNEILERARSARLPTVTTIRQSLDSGALIQYGLNGLTMVKDAANYAARILRGAKPADLPFQQPVRYELIINLKVAKSLGLRIPQSMMVRADQLIE